MKNLSLNEMENVDGGRRSWNLSKCEIGIGFAFGIYCGGLAAGLELATKSSTNSTDT